MGMEPARVNPTSLAHEVITAPTLRNMDQSAPAVSVRVPPQAHVSTTHTHLSTQKYDKLRSHFIWMVPYRLFIDAQITQIKTCCYSVMVTFRVGKVMFSKQ